MILVSIIHIIKGKNRAIEHGMVLFVSGFTYVILPTFYLMADQQFRNDLEKSGLFKAIIDVSVKLLKLVHYIVKV